MSTRRRPAPQAVGAIGLLLLFSLGCWARWPSTGSTGSHPPFEPNKGRALLEPLQTPLRSILDTVSAAPIRLSKIKALGKTLWMATPDWEQNPNYPGGLWYKQAWEHGTFNVDQMEYQIELQEHIPCNQNTWHIQIGSHLGIFPFMAASSGCSAIAVEGNRKHIPYMHLTRALNSQDGRFHIINAIGGDKRRFNLSFGEAEMQLGKPGSLEMVTLDGLVADYVKDGRFLLVIIDVEGYENLVLEGGRQLVASKRVPVFEIEVWVATEEPAGSGKWVQRSSFPGLQLLVDAGYQLLWTPGPGRAFKRCSIADVAEHMCFHADARMSDVFAVLPEWVDRFMALPAFQQQLPASATYQPVGGSKV